MPHPWWNALCTQDTSYAFPLWCICKPAILVILHAQLKLHLLRVPWIPANWQNPLVPQPNNSLWGPVLICLGMQSRGFSLLPIPGGASLQLGCPAVTPQCYEHGTYPSLPKGKINPIFMGNKSEANESEMLCPKFKCKSKHTGFPHKTLILLFSFHVFPGYFIPSTKFQIDYIFKSFPANLIVCLKSIHFSNHFI